MRASGLFSSSEKDDEGNPTGQLYARFRKRITFPIANEQGKTIAFTARALDEVDDKNRPVAKYLNSPETALYTKGHVLFNLDKAKAEIKSHDLALLVEGQMDCISVYMAGVKSVLATSGTAFTEMQVRLLGRFTKRVVVNFDPDTAGQTAAEKSIALLTEEGFEVRVVALEGGLDPDRFIREQGIAAYMTALRGAKRHSDYLIDRARQLFPGRTPDAKDKAMNFLLPHIRRMPNRLHRDEFAADAAQKLVIDSAIMRQELKNAAANRLSSVRSHRFEPASETERVLLRALVLREHDEARQLAAAGLVEHPEWYDGMPAAPLFDALAHGPAPENPLDAAAEDESRAMLAEVLNSQPDPEAVLPAQRGSVVQSMYQQVEHALRSLHVRYLERRQRELRSAIADAERRGDAAMVNTLTLEKMRVDRMLREMD
jgi:DNA primase